MKKGMLLLVMGIFLLAFVLRMGGVAGGVIRGMDAGEYLGLSDELVRDGSLPDDYPGFGATYPEFPGLFAVIGAVSLVCGLPPSEVQAWVGPLTASLSVVLTMFIAYAVFKREDASLASGLFMAVFFAHGASTSITKPSVLGGFLFLLVITLLLRDRKGSTLVAAALAGSALMVTHHLSMIFLLVVLGWSAVSLLFSAENGYRKEAALVALLGTAAFLFWRFGTDLFWERTFALLPVPWWVIFAGVVLPGPLLVLVLRSEKGPAGKLPPKKRMSPLATSVFLALLILVPLGVFLLTKPDGYTMDVGVLYLLAVPPFLLALATGFGIPFLLERRGGMRIMLMLLIPSFIAIIMVLYPNPFLLPHRPLEYSVPFFAVLFGAAFYGLTTFFRNRERAGRGIAAILVVLMLLSIPSAVPRDSWLGGPTYNNVDGECNTAKWLEAAVPQKGRNDLVVAADHRTSAVVQGVSGLNATWYYSMDLILSDSFDVGQCVNQTVPSGSGKAVRVVFITPSMEDGFLMQPWVGYTTLNDTRISKFYGDEFIVLYDGYGGRVFYANY